MAISFPDQPRQPTAQNIFSPVRPHGNGYTFTLPRHSPGTDACRHIPHDTRKDMKLRHADRIC